MNIFIKHGKAMTLCENENYRRIVKSINISQSRNLKTSRIKKEIVSF